MKTKNLKSKRSSKKPILLVVAAVVLLSLMAFGGYKIFHKNQPQNPTTTDGKPVNLEPATNTEKTESDARKDAIVKDEQAQQNSSGSTKTSAIVITDANQNDVRMYVTGVFENDGNCVVTATKGSQVITKNSPGFQNASYTQCAPINWDSPLSSGTWTIKATYTSNTTESTLTKTIEVN